MMVDRPDLNPSYEGMEIDWESLVDELGMQSADAEAESFIHELAHAYDCTGEQAFIRVGPQNEVNFRIRDKYGADDNDEANQAEIRVSAVTQLTLKRLALLTEEEKRDISTSLYANIRGMFTHEAVQWKLDRELENLDNLKVAQTLAEFICSRVS